MKRLTSALRLVAIALPALVAIGTGLAQDIDETEKARLIHAAERGNAQAQFELGARYRGGREGFERNSTEAVRWYRRSAEQGFALAQSYLGIAYALGQSVERDAAEAARWCRLGAEQGDSGGQLCLALLYANGTGVAQDDAEAVRWLRLAGEQGHGVAQARLGDLYASGEDGVRYPFHLLALGDMYRWVPPGVSLEGTGPNLLRRLAFFGPYLHSLRTFNARTQPPHSNMYATIGRATGTVRLNVSAISDNRITVVVKE